MEEWASRRDRIELLASDRSRCWMRLSNCVAVTDATLRPAQRRNAPQRGGPKHLPLLARIHGSYTRKFICGRSHACRRLLRNHARSHPGSMKSALREVRLASHFRSTPSHGRSGYRRSRWQNARAGARSGSGEFIIDDRDRPAQGHRSLKELEGAAYLKAVGVDAINIPDSPRASAAWATRRSALDPAAGRHRDGPALHLPRSQRAQHADRDLSAPRYRDSQPDLHHRRPAEARQLSGCNRGVRRGFHRPGEIVQNLNQGLDLGGNNIGTATAFVIGVGANPGAINLDEEVRRFEYKVEAGAEYCITQPVFDLALLETFLRRVEHCRIPVLAGIWPLTSLRNAEFMKNELRISVP